MRTALFLAAIALAHLRAGAIASLGDVPDRIGDAKGNKEEKKMLKLTVGFDKATVKSGEPFASWCELKNDTGKPIVMKWRNDKLLDFLTYESEGPDGKGKSSGTALFADRGDKVHTFILEPGKTIKHTDSFPQGNTAKPGIYRSKAFFEYRDPDDPKAPVLKAESRVAQIEVVPAD